MLVFLTQGLNNQTQEIISLNIMFKQWPFRSRKRHKLTDTEMKVTTFFVTHINNPNLLYIQQLQSFKRLTGKKKKKRMGKRKKHMELHELLWVKWVTVGKWKISIGCFCEIPVSIGLIIWKQTQSLEPDSIKILKKKKKTLWK